MSDTINNTVKTTVSWSDARAAVVSSVLTHARRGAETIKVNQAVGRVLASTVVSPMDVPHYTSSAMDGFAVRGPSPWRLLAAAIEGAAGRNVHRSGGSLEAGEALPVLTGSLLPSGAEAVVRTEDAEINGDMLHATTPPEGKDIRAAGQERHIGSAMVNPGTALTSRHIAMLCAGGVDEVEVTRQPTIVCAFTGNEIVHSGVPGPGEVRDAFSVSFPAMLESWGARLVSIESVPDDPNAVQSWLHHPATVNADIVVMTGGSGHSSQDFARRVITTAVEAAGVDGEILAAEIACRPGHPTLLARRRNQLVFGAPGNPFAAHVALHSFVAPAIAAFTAAPVLDQRSTSDADIASAALALCRGVCGADIPPLNRDRIRLIPAQRSPHRPDGASGNHYLPVAGGHSHMLTGYALGEVLLIVPASGLCAGDSVDYLKL